MNWLEKYKLKQQKKYYSLINNDYQIPDKYLYIPLFREYNEDIKGKISKEIGKELEQLYDNEDYIMCIHRTQISKNNKRAIEDIFNNGLLNTNGPNLEFTLTPLNHFPVALYQIIYASCYRQNTCNGSVLAIIPKKDLGMIEGEPKPIWFKENEISFRLLPEYIYGYIPCDEKIEEIYRNSNYKKIHNYLNDGLYYDEKAKVEKNKNI